jgi:hypothetical protein
MDPGDILHNFRPGPQPVDALLYFDAADLLEEVRQGFVVLHFVEAQADVVVYAITLELVTAPDAPLHFTGRCRLERNERHCQVELNPDTLTGLAQLLE